MSEIYEMAGHLIRRMHQISMSVFAERMSREGVDLTPVQFAALSEVAERQGLDQATLAGAIAYDRATLGGVVDRLEAKGLLAREVSKSDRRARALTLTPRGEALLDAVRPAVREIQRDMLAGLDEEERASLLRLLQKATDTGNSRSRAPLRP